jgi:hypothetical protein
VGSALLLRAGTPLQVAIVDALPVPNMPAFYTAMRAGLPRARHFILNARSRSILSATLAWLDRHGLLAEDGTICFVPYADAKLKIWRQTGARCPPGCCGGLEL